MEVGGPSDLSNRLREVSKWRKKGPQEESDNKSG